MRRFGWGVGAVMVLLVGSALGGPGPVSAQVAPTLEVSPKRVDPGQPVTFTVRGCPQPPVVTATETDMVFAVEVTAGAEAGTWSGQLPAGQFDWFVDATCGDQVLGQVRLDIDNPLIGFEPIGSMVAPESFPDTVYGADCPDGTEAQVRFDDLNFGEPAPVSSRVVAAPIDIRGDWQADVPDFLAYGVIVDPPPPPGTVLREITVHASCGDVTYAVLRIPVQIAGGEQPIPAPSPVPAPAPSPAPAPAPAPSAPPPARPVSGQADFTG